MWIDAGPVIKKTGGNWIDAGPVIKPELPSAETPSNLNDRIVDYFLGSQYKSERARLNSEKSSLEKQLKNSGAMLQPSVAEMLGTKAGNKAVISEKSGILKKSRQINKQLEALDKIAASAAAGKSNKEKLLLYNEYLTLSENYALKAEAEKALKNMDIRAAGERQKRSGNPIYNSHPLKNLTGANRAFNNTGAFYDAVNSRRQIAERAVSRAGVIPFFDDYAQKSLNSDIKFNTSDYADMTETERGILNYINNTQGEAAARRYYAGLRSAALEDRRYNRKMKDAYEFSKDHKILGSAGSFATNIAGAVEHGLNSLAYLFSGGRYEIPENWGAGLTSRLRGAVTDDINWKIGNWDAFDFLYNTGMSAADSLAGAALSAAVPGAGSVLLGLSAAANAANDIIERGGTNEQAFAGGLAAGVFESLFESASIGNINSLKEVEAKTFKDIIGNVAKSMGVNASEEGLTELANIIYDTFANADISNYKHMLEEYKASGLSEKEAKVRAIVSFALQALEAGASGALMGAGFSGYYSGKSVLKSRKTAGGNRNNYNAANGSKFSIAFQNAKVNSELSEEVKNVEAGNFDPKKKITLGVVSREQAEIIKGLTGIDTNGYKILIENRQLDHIIKEHGKNGRTDRSLAESKIIGKIPFVLEGNNNIVSAGTTKAYVSNVDGKNKPAKTVLYEKPIGENSYYVVEAVPNTSNKTVYIVSAFIGKPGYKKETLQSADAKYPGATPESEAVNVSDIIIPKNDTSVNNGIPDTSLPEGVRPEAVSLNSGGKARRHLNKAEQDYVKKVAENFGVKVIFENVAKVTGTDADSYYDGEGNIHMDFSVKDPVNILIKHELTHFGEDGKLYDSFVSAVKNSSVYKKWLDNKIPGEKSTAEKAAEYTDNIRRRYEAAGFRLSPGEADAELIAHFAADNLFTEGGSGLDALIRQADIKDRPALIQWIIDLIDSVKSLISGQYIPPEILRLERKYTAMLKAAERALGDTGEKNTAEGGNVSYSLSGINKNGIEVYETSDDTKNLTWNERKAKYLDVMKNEYRGRTARFERNGHIYYAEFDRNSIRKHIYGDERSSPNGTKALIKAGADGDVFNLVENSEYRRSKTNTKDHTKADYFDYFVKTVQIDGKVFDLVADVEKKKGVDGGYVYTLALTDNKKTKASPAHETLNEVSVKNAGNAIKETGPQVLNYEKKSQIGMSLASSASTNSISNPAEKVKKFSIPDDQSALLERYENGGSLLHEPSAEELERNRTPEEEFAAGVQGRAPLSVERQYIKNLAGLFGVGIEWTDSPGIEEGFYNRRTETMVLSTRLDTAESLKRVFGHELTHYLENRGLYGDFVKYLTGQSESFARFVETRLADYGVYTDGLQTPLDALLEAVVQKRRSSEVLSENARMNFGRDSALNEVVAEFVGNKVFGECDIETIREIAVHQRTVLERIMDWLRGVIRRITGDERFVTAGDDLKYILDYLSRVYHSEKTHNAETMPGGYNGDSAAALAGAESLLGDDGNQYSLPVYNGKNLLESYRGGEISLEQYRELYRSYIDELVRRARNPDLVEISPELTGLDSLVFAVNLRMLRLAANETQEEFASAIDASTIEINRIEQAKGNVNILYAAKAAKHFGVGIEQLFDPALDVGDPQLREMSVEFVTQSITNSALRRGAKELLGITEKNNYGWSKYVENVGATDVMQVIADNVYAIRVYLGYTQEQFAKICGISTVTLGKIESAQIRINAETLKKISRHSGVPVLDIITGDFINSDETYSAAAAAKRYVRGKTDETSLRKKLTELYESQILLNGGEQLRKEQYPKGYEEQRNVGGQISEADLQGFVSTAKDYGISLVLNGSNYGGFENYRGDVSVLYTLLDRFKENYSFLKSIGYKDKLILAYDNLREGGNIEIGTFAETKGRTVVLNKYLFDDSKFLKSEYDQSVKERIFTQGTNYLGVVDHEMGHLIAKYKGDLIIRKLNLIIEKRAYEMGLSYDEYVKYFISKYAVTNEKELFAEIYAMSRGTKSLVAVEILKELGVY